jgi:glycosyltransferase involved in cell wall biosynthesis
MKILLLSDTYPWPLDNGAIQRVYHLLTPLAAEHHVTLVAGRRGRLSTQEASALEDLGVRVHVVENSEVLDRPDGPYGLWRPIGSQLFDLLRMSQPMTVRRWWSDAIVARLRELRRSEHYDLVWAVRPPLAEMARAAGWPRVLVDLPDLDSVAATRAISTLGAYTTRPLHEVAIYRLRAYERALPKRFAHVVVCKPEDRVFMGSRDNVSIVPNGVEVRPATDTRQARPNDMLFVGSMGYSPNVDAVTYFTSTILPRIRQRQPAARFDIVGKETAKEVLQLHDGQTCVVHGAVPDVAPYYGSAGLVVAPIRLGSGTRLKVLEALMFGKAVVATPIAIEGLDLRAGVDLEVADTPEAFADACHALMTDGERRRRLGWTGRQRARHLYDWARIGKLAVTAASQAVW